MCHAVRVKLSPAEKKDVRKLSGVLIPIYASIALVLLAAIAITQVPRAGEPVTVAKSSSTH